MTQELREIMAELGFRTIDEMVGQVDNLIQKNSHTHWKFKNLDLSPILYKESASPYTALYKQEEQDHGITDVLDWKLLDAAKSALEKGEKVRAAFELKNTNRSIGAILSNEITKKYRAKGLPEDTIHFSYIGTAGQSFAAFNAHGLTHELEGDANDYFGKGLSGAKLIIYPNKKAVFTPEQNIIIGNTAFYGGTSGKAYIRGKAGERFCVRNSGVNAVVEGVGDHGCEYMTGGRVVILGETGRNFAAGMSGGIAYIYDVKGDFENNCNKEMVDLDPVDEEGAAEIRKMLEDHYAYTKSAVAQFVLADFDNQLKHFITVFPTDYKKVLQSKTNKKALTK
jgi:glutamate synthase (NADPH) large chain